MATKQAALPGVEPATPKPVRGKKMMMQFLKPFYSRTKGGDPIIGLDLSMPLTDDHNGLLPREILDNWTVIQKDNAKRIDVSGISPQKVSIFIVPDDNDPLTFVATACRFAL